MGWLEDIRKRIESGIASISKGIASWERRTGIDIPFIGTSLKEEEERRKAIEEWEKEHRVSPEEVKKAVEFAQQLAGRKEKKEEEKKKKEEKKKGEGKVPEPSPVAILPPERKYYERRGYKVVDLSKTEEKPKYAEVKETEDSIEIAIPVIQKGHGVKADTLRAIEKNLENYKKKGFEVKREYKNGKLIYRILPPVKTYKTIYEVYPYRIKQTIIDADTGKVIDEKEYRPSPGEKYDVLKVKEWLKKEYGVSLKKNKAEIVEKVRQKFDIEKPKTEKLEIEKPFTLPIALAYPPLRAEDIEKLPFWERIKVKKGLSDEELKRIQYLATQKVPTASAAIATVGKTGFGADMLFNYIAKRLAGKSHEKAVEEAVYEPVIETMVEAERARPAIFGGKAPAQKSITFLAAQGAEAGGKAFLLYGLPTLVTEKGLIGKISEATLRGLQAVAVAQAVAKPTPENVATAALVTIPELAIRAISPVISRVTSRSVKGLKVKEVKLKVEGENIMTLRTKANNKYLRIGEVEMYTNEGPIIKALLLAKTKRTRSGKLAQDLIVEIPEQRVHVRGEIITIPRKRIRIKSLDIITKTIGKYSYESVGKTKVAYEEGIRIRPENIREFEVVRGEGELMKVMRNKEALTGEKHVTLKTMIEAGGGGAKERGEGGEVGIWEIGKEISGLRSKELRTGEVKERYIEEGFVRGKKEGISYGWKTEVKGDTRDFLVLRNKYLIFEREISPQQFQKLIAGRGWLEKFFKVEEKTAVGKSGAIGERVVGGKPSISSKGKQEYVSPSELLKLKTVKQPPKGKEVPGLKISEGVESALFRRSVGSIVERTKLIRAIAKGAGGAKGASISTGNIGRILPYLPVTFFTRLSRISEESKRKRETIVGPKMRESVRESRIKIEVPKTTPIPPKTKDKTKELITTKEFLEFSTPTTVTTSTKTTTKTVTKTVIKETSPTLDLETTPFFEPSSEATIKRRYRTPFFAIPPSLNVRFSRGAKMKAKEKEIRRKFPRIEELLTAPSLNVNERKIPYLSSTIIRKVREKQKAEKQKAKGKEKKKVKKEVKLRRKKGRVRRITPTDFLRL